MGQVAPLNRYAAKENPGSHFAHPEDIVDNILLTSGEKLVALNRWRNNILSELAAADDGMKTHKSSTALLGLLSSVEKSISTLRRASA